ncbi:hypothetical protein ACFYWY_23300 [Streptomyces sp. NPDC002870]|uniref:hypothetical protein n=1 Tax=Streptomyces sp. NPDC002870 TaxID=3364666 RepID=UPI0036BF8B8D
MDTAVVVLLGAAGGSLRGFIDAYSQTMAWRSARREHRRSTATGQEGPTAPPKLNEFFDPVPELVAVLFHMALGAGAAFMFGLSGQIDGEYAAIAVGISAPALLTQVGQVPTISEAVAGPQQQTQPPPQTQPQAQPVDPPQARELAP